VRGDWGGRPAFDNLGNVNLQSGGVRGREITLANHKGEHVGRGVVLGRTSIEARTGESESRNTIGSNRGKNWLPQGL